MDKPVAWRTFDGEGGYDYRSFEGNENYADEWDKRNPKHKGWVEPLYNHPQPAVQYQLSPTDIYDFAGWLTTRPGVLQVGSSYEAGPMAEAVGEYLKKFPERFSSRKWVGLTDEEMHDCWDSPLTPLGMKHARMIEAKLKQKNGYTEEKNNG